MAVVIPVAFVPAESEHRAIGERNASAPMYPLAVNPGAVCRMVREPELLPVPMQSAVPGGNVIARNFNICVHGRTQYRWKELDFDYSRAVRLARVP